jgi:hypothetical protein
MIPMGDFQRYNGVSRHSFMGAVPFIAAAKITENRYIRNSLYLGFMLCGWPKLNADHHHFSQGVSGLTR